MRYLDTGSRDPEQTLHAWLRSALKDATYFGCQTGYFSFDGIFPLMDTFEAILQKSGVIHLVVGGNEAGIRRVDIEDVLDLFDAAPTSATTSLTLVAADDLLMHPKTYYTENANGERHALVSSANLTHAGLCRNIEAALAIDSHEDPDAPFKEIKDAIERWGKSLPPNAYQVTRASLDKLVKSGALDIQRVIAKVPTATHKKRGKIFPTLGGLIKLPRKKRKVAPVSKVQRVANPGSAVAGSLETLGEGTVGILKRLGSLDVKGFEGKRGTLYIALPKDLSYHLPMAPYGRNLEPRFDIEIEARMEDFPQEVARSGASPTNVTHVGMGEKNSSHPDLRLNYHRAIRDGIAEIAQSHAIEVPRNGDLAAIEFLSGGRVRLTFITDPVSIENLTPLLDQPGQAEWGWLPSGIIGPWDEQEV